jgi:hypothetical protein
MVEPGSAIRSAHLPDLPAKNPVHNSLPNLGVQPLDLALLARVARLAGAAVKRARRLVLQLLLPCRDRVGANLMALRQLVHTRLLAQPLQGDLRLQPRVNPSSYSLRHGLLRLATEQPLPQSSARSQNPRPLQFNLPSIPSGPVCGGGRGDPRPGLINRGFDQFRSPVHVSPRGHRPHNHRPQSEDARDFDGKALLIVNVASQCGFTPQYAGLEALHRRFRERGFAVLGFPCDQFGHQEPGDESAIQRFCKDNYDVTFPMFAETEVRASIRCSRR